MKGGKRYKSGGRWYYYHRASQKRISAEPGTPAFFAEIDRLNGAAPKEDAPKTPGALIIAYRGSPEFLGLADNTRQDYQDVFDYLQPIAGTILADINSSVILGMRDKAYAKHKRRFANYVVQVMSLLYTWGNPRKWSTANHAASVPKIRKPKGAPQANRPWTDPELSIVLKDFRKAPLPLPGLALGVSAAVTEADVIRLPWSAYDGGRLHYFRGKTGVEINIPAHRDLRAILDPLSEKKTSPVIVTNSRAEPYTVSGFRGMFFKRIRALEKAGAISKGLTFHGLRHTVATRLAEAGAAPQEIMAVLGHATEKMAHHYSKQASRQKSGDAVVIKLERKRKPRV